jgi:transcriptional regulator with XRE-family HTH domain
MYNDTSIGERIKSLRRQFKMTQIEFAKRVGISQGTLSEIESGNAKPSFDVLFAIGKNFTVDLNWLVTNTDHHSTLKSDELTLLKNYRQLEDIAKEEMLDYTDLKLLRFQKKGES